MVVSIVYMCSCSPISVIFFRLSLLFNPQYLFCGIRSARFSFSLSTECNHWIRARGLLFLLFRSFDDDDTNNNSSGSSNIFYLQFITKCNTLSSNLRVSAFTHTHTAESSWYSFQLFFVGLCSMQFSHHSLSLVLSVQHSKIWFFSTFVYTFAILCLFSFLPNGHWWILLLLLMLFMCAIVSYLLLFLCISFRRSVAVAHRVAVTFI